MKKNEQTVLSILEMIKIKNRIQKEACQSVIKEFNLCKEEGRKLKTILNLATGVGKTRTAWKLVFEHMDANTVLFMVPKISLIDQTIAEWLSLGINFEYATAYTSGDLKSVEDIQEFMAKETSVKKIIFAVYNSVGVDKYEIESNITRSGVEFDLAIYDECHNCAGKKFGLFTSCANDDIVKATAKLFMTATIKEYEDNEDEDGNLIETNNLFSMANTDIFGNVAYSLTIAKAIKLGILCNFKTYLLEVSDARIKAMLNKELLFLGDIVKGQHLATAYAVINSYNKGARKMVIVYHEKADAHDFNRLFTYMQKELGVLKGANIACVASDVTPAELQAPSSYMDNNDNLVRIKSNDNRKAQQWHLKYGPFCSSDTSIVTSSPWLKEGEDIPCIDCIVFGDRFTSGIAIIQMIGRALRWSEGKVMAHIILPVMEGEVNKAARAIRNTIGNMQDEVNEFQTVTQEVATTTTTTTNDIDDTNDINDDEPEVRDPRWVFDTDSTTTTTVNINGGEMEVEVIHDNTFTLESQIEHEEMLMVVGLKLTNKYNQYLESNKTKRFVDEKIRLSEDFIDGNSQRSRDGYRDIKSNKEYIKLFANENEITFEEATIKLSPYMHKFDKLRENNANLIF